MGTIRYPETKEVILEFLLLTKSSAFLIGPIATLLGYIMDFIYEACSLIGIQNIGLCIILFTIITNVLMLPLTIKQQKFTKLNAVMNPEIQEIQNSVTGIVQVSFIIFFNASVFPFKLSQFYLFSHPPNWFPLFLPVRSGTWEPRV